MQLVQDHMFNDSKIQITKEISTAVNIKDKKNRKKVLSSLKAISSFLKRIKNRINNGIVIFSGVDFNGQVIFESYIMNLPLKKGFYCCDKKFHTYFLEKYCDIADKYLIMYITGTETFYYEKKLTDMRLLKKISFQRQKKQKKGGQSQARIARLREEKMGAFANKSTDFLKTYQHNFNYKSIIITGNGSIIDLIKIPNVNKIRVTDKTKLLEACDNFINEMSKDSSNKYIEKYMNMMDQADDKLVYGGDSIVKMISQGLIEEILIHKKSKYYPMVKDYKNKIIIRSGTRDGDIFLQNFEGIMGKLYYKMDYLN